jgi:hypothetical protein
VRNAGFDNVTVKNGTVTELDYGVQLNPGTAGNAVTAVSALNDESAGVQLVDADSNTVSLSQVSGFSQVGIHVTDGSCSTFPGPQTGPGALLRPPDKDSSSPS